MALSCLGLLAPGFGLQDQGDACSVQKPLDHSSSVCLNQGPLILLGEKYSRTILLLQISVFLAKSKLGLTFGYSLIIFIFP